MANQLSKSKSAYLKSAAHQPINWYEFSDEAFEKAKKEDKPILLDIGAVWCHWCHVIDRESYENDEIAELINKHYVAVKVDRDQRPDIDARYQQVVMALSGQGGWPLTGFLTYDGRLIYGGTYFTPEAMKQLLEDVARVYKEKKDEIFGSDQVLSEKLIEKTHEREKNAVNKDAAITDQFYEEIIKNSTNMYDRWFGGFGVQPKFHHFSLLEFLLIQLARTQSPQLKDLIEKSLTEMARGGVYDQIGGGFHRYSVDRIWHVPHFEKMAYDNSEALKVYAQAFHVTGKTLFREIAEDIIRFVDRDFSDRKNGGFYASQDADINLDDDGDYFTWTLDEVREALTPKEADLLTLYYDITPKGDMHERPGRNVLKIKPITMDIVAAQLQMSEESALPLLKLAKEKLLAARSKRVTPYVDSTLFTNWNGLMITGYLEAADLLDLPQAREFALKSLDHILSLYYTKNDMLLHCEGVAGNLDDYAQLSMALLRAYQSTGEEKYLTTTKELMEQVFKHFEDSELGGFFDVREDAKAIGLLKFRRKPMEDTPSASANGTLLEVLNQLHFITGDQTYKNKTEKALNWFAGLSAEKYIYVGALGTALFHFMHPPLKIELVGDDKKLFEKARSLYSPGKILVHNKSEKGVTEARLCISTRCHSPAQTPQDLEAGVEHLHRTLLPSGKVLT